MTPAEPLPSAAVAPWAFDAQVTAVFPDMLRRSIPQYETMRELVTDLASDFRQPNTDIIDLGTSRGDAVAPLIARFGAENRYVLAEISEPMLETCRERFRGYIDAGLVELRREDLRHSYPPARASVTLAVLTLQFVPMEHRQRLLEAAYRHTVPGGALVIVEKLLGETGQLSDWYMARYWRLKADNGYSAEAIYTKAQALEGVLVSTTERELRSLCAAAGWGTVDCFWRWCNFAGFVALRT